MSVHRTEDTNSSRPQTLSLLGTSECWISLLAWLLALVALWQLAGVPPARGYELSIYDALPRTFLFTFQASLGLHVFVAARSGFRNRNDAISVTALSGIVGIVFNTTVALALPYLRGYLALGGDMSTHLATSLEVASTWTVPERVFYPALYSIVQVAHVATGLDNSTIWFLGAVGSYILWVMLCVMAAGRLLSDKRAALIGGVAAAVPVAGAYLRAMVPVSVSVHLLPLLFYLYARSRHREGQSFNLLLVLLLTLLPFLHPLTSLMAILWLALLEVVRWTLPRAPFWQSIVNSARTRGVPSPPSLNLTATLILGVTWIAWLSSSALWNRSIRQVVEWLLGEAHTQLDKIDYLAGRSGLSTIELSDLVVKKANGIVIYTGLAVATLPLFMFLIRRRKVGTQLAQYLVPLYALFAFSASVAGFAIVGPWGTLDLYRFARFMIPWDTLLLATAPLLISQLRPPSRLIASALVICVLIVVALGGFRALHHSPFVFEPNRQTTAQEVSCMQWIYYVRDSRDIRGVWSLDRQAQLALGVETAWSLPSLWYPLPDHFGYDGAPSLDRVLARPTYLLITEYDRATVLHLWASADKYAEEDFRRLETDRSAILLYANGGCDIWAAELGMEYHTQ